MRLDAKMERYLPVYRSDEGILLRMGQIREFSLDGEIFKQGERLFLGRKPLWFNTPPLGLNLTHKIISAIPDKPVRC